MSSSDPVSISATLCQLVGGSSVLVSSRTSLKWAGCSLVASLGESTLYQEQKNCPFRTPPDFRYHQPLCHRTLQKRNILPFPPGIIFSYLRKIRFYK